MTVLPGYKQASILTLRGSAEEASKLSLDVHLVAFATDSIHEAKDAVYAGLPWPQTIERSVSKRRSEFLFGRLAARTALADIAPDLARRQIAIGNHREPIFPRGTIGSITHIKGLAAAVVGADTSWSYLGLDLEDVAKGVAQDALRSLVLDAHELDLLCKLLPKPSPSELDKRVTHVFSAKECLFKAAFPTVRQNFDFSAARLSAFNVLSDDCGPSGRVALDLRRDLGGRFHCDARFWVDLWPVPKTKTTLALIAG